LVSCIETIAGGQLDFNFVQFVPLGVGPIPLRDGAQFPQAATRIRRSRQIARQFALREFGYGRLTHWRLTRGQAAA
jgi:hypothetical protein